MRKLLLVFTLLFVATVFVACGQDASLPVDADNYEAIIDRGYIVVGLECGYAPFNWTVGPSDASEEAVQIDRTRNYCDGYDVAVASFVAEELGVDLVIKAVEWDGLIPSLADAGSIDLIIAGMSPTAERAQTIAFTNEYYHSTHVLLVRADSEYADADSLTDFNGARVVGQMSTIYDDLIDQIEGVIHANPLETIPTIVTAIKAGNYDATVVELPVAVAIVQNNPDLTYVTFAEGQGFEVAYEDAAVAIALRQAEVTLRQEINRILALVTEAQREAWMLAAIERQPQ
jgi:ABC-type amino acid transport substrate-binding protein